MNKMYSVICAAMLSLSATAAMSASASLPSKLEIDSITAGATVTAIDKANRSFTLTAKNGKTYTYAAGPEMVNFDQLKVGDAVEATYAEEASISVNKTGAAPKMTTKEAVVRAPKGAKPGIIVASSTEVIGVVTAIDQKTRSVTVKGPQGNEITKTVGADVKNFKNVAKGDNVVISYTEALSISVATPAAAAKP